MLTEGQGSPLVAEVTAANVNDGTRLERLVDGIPPIRRPLGRPRRRPHKLHADKAYDYACYRALLRQRGIVPRIARKGIESSERLGRYRWKVERTLAWLHQCRRLRIRYERRVELHQAFLSLACALICWNFLQ